MPLSGVLHTPTDDDIKDSSLKNKITYEYIEDNQHFAVMSALRHA